MLQKIYFVMVTLLLHLRYPSKLTMKGIQKIRFDTEVLIKNGGRILLGERTTVFRKVTFTANGGNISIGDHTFFNRNCIVASQASVSIGSYCIFGPNVLIYDHDHIYNEGGYISGKYNKEPVLIEDHCWVGANVIILRGAHIGEGSIIGAGAIVKGIIPAHSLVTNSRDLYIKPIASEKPHICR